MGWRKGRRKEDSQWNVHKTLQLIHDVNKGRISYIGTSICRTASLCAGEKDNDKKRSIIRIIFNKKRIHISTLKVKEITIVDDIETTCNKKKNIKRFFMIISTLGMLKHY